jgi:hypothetical protein
MFTRHVCIAVKPNSIALVLFGNPLARDKAVFEAAAFSPMENAEPIRTCKPKVKRKLCYKTQRNQLYIISLRFASIFFQLFQLSSMLANS